MANARASIDVKGEAADTVRTDISPKAGRVDVHVEVRKPLLASVGAADLAVEKLFTLPTAYGSGIKKLSGKVGGQAARVPVQAGTVVLSLPGTVSSQWNDFQERASQLYSTFADRGEKRVSSIRRNPATQEAVNRTKAAVSQTKAAVNQTKTARTSGRKAAEAAGKAVSEAVQPS